MSDLSGLTAVRLVVSGRVQGVGFRASTVEAAREAGVDGWVRNLADGRVEIHAQGSGAAIESFARWVRRGPRWARVGEVVERRADLEKALRGFEIRL